MPRQTYKVLGSYTRPFKFVYFQTKLTRTKITEITNDVKLMIRLTGSAYDPKIFFDLLAVDDPGYTMINMQDVEIGNEYC